MGVQLEPWEAKKVPAMLDKNIKHALDAVMFRISDPERIPAKRYYDPGFFEAERQKLWPRVWQMACRLEEIQEIGDYVEYTMFEKRVIVIRGKSGVKAFHNVCRHRGMRLVEGSGNCKNTGIICPFHGWRYNAEGKNTFVFGRGVFSEEQLDPDEISLKPCGLELWGGCAFINFDDQAPSLLESLGPITEKLEARHVDKLRTEWWYASVLPVNWKLAVEAFQEMYHLMRTHPEMHRLTPGVFGLGDSSGVNPSRQSNGGQTVSELIDYFANVSEGMAGVIHAGEIALLEQLRDMEVPDDPVQAAEIFMARARDAITQDGRRRGLPIFDVKAVCEAYPSMANEFIFPNFWFLPMFGCMASYRIRPLTPETCLFEIWSLILVPEGEPYASPRQPTLLPHDSPDYPLIPRQDYSNLPNQQLGLRSGEIEFQRLSRTHEGLISNFHRLIDGYLAGLDGERLARAAHVVNGGSFLPIRDLGF
jgi:nitrite reductase/ring-hydroxylating ferredoxin subunit